MNGWMEGRKLEKRYTFSRSRSVHPSVSLSSLWLYTLAKIMLMMLLSALSFPSCCCCCCCRWRWFHGDSDIFKRQESSAPLVSIIIESMGRRENNNLKQNKQTKKINIVFRGYRDFFACFPIFVCFCFLIFDTGNISTGIFQSLIFGWNVPNHIDTPTDGSDS